ncbi:MAG TPA: flagellar export chaperone FliS [Verrucomicrobiae bacterium]|jgi:flagellar protein FliS|nr:flagellar export chaperone FliS [Verrucomicrobiae bacterium]
MMSRNKPWDSYRKVATQTATPGQLVLMLYDGALRFLDKAQAGFEYEDPKHFNETINNNILRAQAIIHELNASLDMKAGAEVASNFRSLYNYFYRRLTEANHTKQKAPLEEVISHIRELRDSWAEMLRRGGDNDPAADPRLTAAAA